MKKVLKILLLLLIVASAVAVFFNKEVPVVETDTVTKGPAVEAVYATGTVEATVMMPIASKITARLMEMNVDEGSNVTKGQQLAKLEDEDLQNSLAELQAKEVYAHKNYLRKSELAKRGYETKSALDQSKSDWDAAQAAVARASSEAGFTKLVSPADGLIIRRDGEVGQMIPANQTVFWLSCCAPLRISAEVDEEDISRVQPGQDVLIRADAFPDKTYHGKVKSITPKGDPVARSYRVRIDFTDENPLRIGMTTESNIIIGEKKEALLVPSSALSQGKVWVVSGNGLVRKAVVTGVKGAEKTEIASGLSLGDSVVVNADPDLKEGQKVRARKAERTDTSSPAPGAP